MYLQGRQSSPGKLQVDLRGREHAIETSHTVATMGQHARPIHLISRCWIGTISPRIRANGISCSSKLINPSPKTQLGPRCLEGRVSDFHMSESQWQFVACTRHREVRRHFAAVLCHRATILLALQPDCTVAQSADCSMCRQRLGSVQSC